MFRKKEESWIRRRFTYQTGTRITSAQVKVPQMSHPASAIGDSGLHDQQGFQAIGMFGSMGYSSGALLELDDKMNEMMALEPGK